jgi:predicted nuclease of predicted toxin-antitoxin system
LSLAIYLDDSADAHRLVAELTGAPHRHRVVRPREAGLTGREDAEHFAYARAHDLILLTKNPADFLALHQQYPQHPGLFIVCQDNTPTDMTATDIAGAIQNLLAAGVPITDAFHILNHWRY